MNRLRLIFFRRLSKLTAKLNSYAQNRLEYYRVVTPRTEDENKEFLDWFKNLP